MTTLEYRLAAALLRRMWQRSLVSKEQYLCACTFFEEEQIREKQDGTNSKVKRTAAHGEISL